MKSGLFGSGLLFLLLLSLATSAVSGIDCFNCDSRNGSNPDCEDPFSTNVVDHLVHECKSYKRDRDGVFPADHCIKIKGVAAHDHNQTVMVRTCALDSGTLTADTEIVRMSHCGFFFLDNIYYKGCVQSCSKNGCNAASNRLPAPKLMITMMLSLFAMSLYFRRSFRHL